MLVALTDTFVKNAKPSGASTGVRHTDGHGLYVHVKDSGKYWRMGYRFNGKQKTLAMDICPANQNCNVTVKSLVIQLGSYSRFSSRMFSTAINFLLSARPQALKPETFAVLAKSYTSN